MRIWVYLKIWKDTMQEKICVVSKKSMKSEVQKSTGKKSGGKSGTLPYHHSSSDLRGGKFNSVWTLFSRKALQITDLNV